MLHWTSERHNLRGDTVNFWSTLFRALRLRCPACGSAPVFRRYSFRMPAKCEACGLTLQGEAGFYLGSIYVNYGITSVVALVAFVLLKFGWRAESHWTLTICVAIAVVLPVLLFRHSRSLWLALDTFFDRSHTE